MTNEQMIKMFNLAKKYIMEMDKALTYNNDTAFEIAFRKYESIEELMKVLDYYEKFKEWCKQQGRAK